MTEKLVDKVIAEEQRSTKKVEIDRSKNAYESELGVSVTEDCKVNMDEMILGFDLAEEADDQK